MPNNVKNSLKILGTPEQVQKVFNELNTHYPAELRRADNNEIICRQEGEEWSVGWFNEHTGVFSRRNKKDVIGLPEGWSLEIKDAYDHFPDFNKVIPQPENIFTGDLGDKERKECRKKGIPNWLDWNRANWGTKWNCYSCEKVSYNTFTFETAWSGVPEMMEVLSKKFPEIEFIYEYADEDTGYNTGYYNLENGIITEHHPEDGSKEAYDLAFRLRPHYKDDYELVDGEWKYKEEQAELE